jgi:nucleoside 2-deoxyribosyltransferase
LSSPYSFYELGHDKAAEHAAEIVADLVEMGVHTFSPIVHGHPLSKIGKLDAMDLNIWYPFNETIMARCDVLIVAHLPGWETSKGITHEVAFFTAMRKPIFDLEPTTLSMSRRMNTKVMAG